MIFREYSILKRNPFPRILFSILLISQCVVGCKDKDEGTRYTSEQISATRTYRVLMNVPEANIAIDGEFDDWQQVSLVVTDEEGESSGGPSTDVSRIRVAKSSTELFFNMDLVGNYTFPHTPDTISYYQINLLLYSDTKCLEKLAGDYSIQLTTHSDNSVTMIADGTVIPYKVTDNSLEFVISQSSIPANVKGIHTVGVVYYDDGGSLFQHDVFPEYYYINCMRFRE